MSTYATQAAIECAGGHCMKVGLIALVVLIGTIILLVINVMIPINNSRSHGGTKK